MQEAFETVDHAANGAPEFFMVNQTHPTHFEQTIGTAITEPRLVIVYQ